MSLQFKEISSESYTLLNPPLEDATSYQLPIEQTFEWGKFQDALPDRHFLGCFGIYEGKKLLVLGSFVLIRMEFSNKFLDYQFLWCKEGPILTEAFHKLSRDQKKETLEALFGGIHEECLSKKYHPCFLRFHLEGGQQEGQGGDPSLRNTHPYLDYISKTLLLDLTLSEEELLAQMKQKGRYNIKLAEKKGVTVEVFQPDSEGFEKALYAFYAILKDTSKRDRFSAHTKEYYHRMLEHLGEKAKLYMARCDHKWIGGIIVTSSGECSTYYYGASSNEYRNVMAPYLLQWRAIQDVKKGGFKYYDFLGISSKENDGLEGVTQFKRQFGGIEKDCLKVFEYPFRKIRYLLIKFMRFLKKFR